MTSPNKAREGVSRATTNSVADEGFSSLPPTLGTVAGPTPEPERVARAIHEARDTSPYPWWHTNFDTDVMSRHLARAALSALLPVSDETVEAMMRAVDDEGVAAYLNRDCATAALTAAIHHITGEGQ